MSPFIGFEKDKGIVRIPAEFFTELLAEIDDFNELKITLYCLWRIQLREGNLLYLKESEIAADSSLMNSLRGSSVEESDALKDALEKAVKRSTLLSVPSTSPAQECLYFVNTERSRQAIIGLNEGRWNPDDGFISPPRDNAEKPNIYSVYENNIGPLTPIIADDLADLIEEYSEEWVNEAILIAVRNNVRKLAYAEAVLKRWKTDGKGDNPAVKTDYRRYRSGKYGSEIES